MTFPGTALLTCLFLKRVLVSIRLKKVYFFLFLGLVAVTCIQASDSSLGLASDAITDVDSKEVQFKKPGVVTVVLGCSEDSQSACRRASYVLDRFRGRTDLRLIAVVDLRDSLGGFLKDYVRERMRADLDSESMRLRPFYQANHNNGNPRNDLCAIPDFNGEICRVMGWNESLDESLHAVVYSKDNKEIGRWNNLKNYNELEAVVVRALPPLNPVEEEPTRP
jgi:hypothetical protein